MKTDYRVVCCVVAWLCCAAVQCRKDNSDWDNSDGNGVRDFGREYDGDDELTFLGRAYDISNDFLKQLADADGTEDCGAECDATGGTCEPLEEGSNTKQCNCPSDTLLEDKKCIVEDSKCLDLFPACQATGGSCLSTTGGIKCSCPNGANLKEDNNICVADDSKCPEILPNCKTTGGSCLSSANGITCKCPKDTTLENTEKKCIVDDKKCTQLFPDCKNTGGTCSSSPEGIQCTCPKDTVFNKDHKACEVEDKKCAEVFPHCKTTGGSCLSVSEFIECRCPKDTTFEENEKKCIVKDEKCADLFPNCINSKGSCVSSSKGIECSCPEGTALNDTEKKCVVTDEKCAALFENCKTSGGTCMYVSDDIKCICPEGTHFDDTEKKCKVDDTKCDELYPGCKTSRGTCLSIVGGIKCSCPEGTTFKETGGKCVVEGAKCTELFPNCTPSGGTCISSTDGITCSCPVDAIFEENEKKCIVEGTKCKERFPNCETTGGKCVPYTDGIKCSCPEGTTLESTNQKCIVDEPKCLALYPNCKNTGGACQSLAEGIKCICPEGTTFSEADKKCIVSDEKCGELFPNCKSSGGSCMSSAGGIKCSCPEGSSFEDTEKKCIVCDCGEKSTGCKFEEGKKICSCPQNFADKQGKCSECDCGPKSEKCKFEDDKKVCTCSKGYEDRDGICAVSKCTEKCGEGYEDKNIECITTENGQVKCECSEKSKGFDYTLKQCKDCACGSDSEGCKFEGNKKVCLCKGGFADKDGTCTACECGENAEGCTFDKKGKTCQCKEKYADKSGTCEKCNCDDAYSIGCSFKGEDKKCDCIKDYADDKGTCKKDYCQFKCGCDAGGCGGDTYCEGNKFEEGLVCGCNDEPVKKFDSTLKKCRKPCTEENNECKYGAECKGGDVKFCVCHKDKTSGDTCADVIACGKGGKYENCVKEKGRCDFDVTRKDAVCICDRGKKLDETKNYCVDKFCVEGNCQDGSECQYDNETHTGYCKCKKGQYYDYQDNRCKVPDKCLLKKKPCEENEVCVDGVCKCPSPYEKDGDKCIKKFCKPNPCFTGANCTDADSSCFCEEGKFFTGSKCEEKKCILDNDYAEKCACPRGMNREENKCVPISGKACEKDCGYGLCVNDICRCFPGAELKNEICVLKTSFCASGKLVSGSRSQCLCDGKLKQAKDGKTCELITCDDESAKTECAQKGATCKMTWRGTPKFDCECPDGYTMDRSRNICTDPCSLQDNIDNCLKKQKFCFNSNSKRNSLTGDCKCPPPFTNAEGCTVLDKNIYLISGIPVAKKHYEMKHGINHVLLNTNLTQSLAQTYSSNVFDYGYLYDYEVTDKEIMCSVWVRFKLNASEHLERLPYQAQQFTEGVCEDCDTSMFVWPPALPLSRKLNEVHYENLNLCSTAVKDKLCGREASCTKETGCYCPKGSRMLEYTFREISEGKRMQRCEATTKSGDLDECKMGTHNCSKNSECVKIPGDFICQCKPGFWKVNNYDKQDCQDLCAKKPCVKGKCSMKKENFNCECEPGYGGSRCDQKDVNFASAKKSTVVVGAVLGTILIVGIIAFLLYYRKVRKSSYSEDFMPAPSHSEMTERRPMRGIANKSYE